MNEVAAIQSVYDVLNAAKATLVTDLTHGGVAREVKSLKRTVLAVPDSYYAMAIDCSDIKEYAAPSQNISKATSGLIHCEYQMIVKIADVAYPDQGEDEVFLTSHNNFRTFCDRVARLLRETRFFPSVSATPRFCLKMDRTTGIEMKRENINLIYEGTSLIILASWLRFTLMDPNSDTSLLY